MLEFKSLAEQMTLNLLEWTLNPVFNMRNENFINTMNIFQSRMGFQVRWVCEECSGSVSALLS
jgi:hypothetical protein